MSYVDFLIPGLAAAGAMFVGHRRRRRRRHRRRRRMLDRLRSLPVPEVRSLLGRSLADTALVGWGLFVTVAVGFATGFRFHGSLSTPPRRSGGACCCSTGSRGRGRSS